MKKIHTVLSVVLASSLLFTSCKKNLDISDSKAKIQSTNPENCNCKIEQAFTIQKGDTVTFGKGKDAVHLEKFGEQYVLDGDILLSSQQVEFLKRRATKTTSNKKPLSTFTLDFLKLWPNNTIYYYVDPALPNQSRVTEAIAYWQSVTPLTFVPRTSQSNYVYIHNGDGCSSSIGMIGGEQHLTLGENCSTGNLKHEIGHAIGLFHEQSRADRDDYIDIVWANIIDDKKNNFKTYIDIGEQGFQLGSYDFNSIMAYDSYAFSKDQNGLTKPTIYIKGTTQTFGVQRSVLSTGDLQAVNYIYNPSVYVKHRTILTYENTYYGSSNETEQYEYDHYLEFYSDAALSSPMSLILPMYVRVQATDSYLGQQPSIGVNNIRANPGQNSLYIGHTTSDKAWEYGNITRFEEHSYTLLPGIGYKK